MTRPLRAAARAATAALIPLLLLPPRASGAEAGPAPDGVWPLEPRPAVVAGFDPPADRWGRGHRGVDLAGRFGQPVRAALAGTVSVASAIAGRGVLVVDHGPTRTTYEPVAALVAVGTTVGRGEVVGRLERAGSHCFPQTCLHWGWRRGETYLDPLRLVGGGPVRLLPLGGAGGGPSGPPTADAAARVVATLAGLFAGGRVPCTPQARGWACR